MVANMLPEILLISVSREVLLDSLLIRIRYSRTGWLRIRTGVSRLWFSVCYSMYNFLSVTGLKLLFTLFIFNIGFFIKSYLELRYMSYGRDEGRVYFICVFSGLRRMFRFLRIYVKSLSLSLVFIYLWVLQKELKVLSY